MGICGASSYSKNEKSKKNKTKHIIKISVKYNNETEKEISIDENEKLFSIIKELGQNEEADYDFYDSNNILINDKIDSEISKIFKSKNKILISIKKVSLNLVENNRKYIADNTSLVGTLTFNNNSSLGIFIYNTQTKQIFSQEFSYEKYPLLKNINNFTSFCNSKNSLYISGGEDESINNQGQDLFIKINLEEIKSNELIYSNLTPLKYKRYWHSMIYIPEKYIYIIGGPGTKQTELYNIENNTIILSDSLNYERCEPSLVLVDNKYLYCICGFQLDNNFIDTIEKCDLNKRERKWEIVNYQIKSGEDIILDRSLIVSFFGVSYIKNDILLIGDKENNKVINPNYLLKPNDKDIDIIEEYGYIEGDNTRLFSEKFFIPINESESIALPFKKGDAKILMLNNNDGKIKEIILNENIDENDISRSKVSFNV